MSADSSAVGVADLSEAELAVAALERLMCNGASALGHEMLDQYRQGWFNALGFMAGMIGHDLLTQTAFDLGEPGNDGATVIAKAEAVFGPREQWPRDKWLTPARS